MRSLFVVGICATLSLAVAFTPSPSAADNGAVALGVPVTGIQLDGDLSDWPDGMRRYEIARSPWTSAPPTGPEDFSAWFIAGYSVEENALYVGVEVRDESSVVENPMAGVPAWFAFDGIELYVGKNGSQAESGQWSSAGTAWTHYGTADSSQWVPSMSHRPDGHTYEPVARFLV